jgi:hypothetical protein
VESVAKFIGLGFFTAVCLLAVSVPFAAVVGLVTVIAAVLYAAGA